MKRFFILLFIVATFSVAGHSQGYHYDVNGDGSVTSYDITALYNYLLNNDMTYYSTSDINGDGEVTAADVTAVYDILLGGNSGGNPSVGGHEYVDLGLPSGTLWATMNIGASSPEDYGDYFSWGDTSPKNYYDWSTCNWCDGVFSFTKYNDTDGKTELDPEDDAATANWGAMWHMPSKEQIIELIDNCTCLWTEKNGVKGQLLISKINGASLFFPAGGNAGGGSHYNVGTKGWFLSRTIEGWFAYSLQITSSGANLDHYGRRELGFPVRAVRVSQK